MGRALIAQSREVEAVQEMLAGPKQPRRDRRVELVDEPRFEVPVYLAAATGSCRRLVRGALLGPHLFGKRVATSFPRVTPACAESGV